MAMAESPRSMVGQLAPVPRNVTERFELTLRPIHTLDSFNDGEVPREALVAVLLVPLHDLEPWRGAVRHEGGIGVPHHREGAGTKEGSKGRKGATVEGRHILAV